MRYAEAAKTKRDARATAVPKLGAGQMKKNHKFQKVILVVPILGLAIGQVAGCGSPIAGQNAQTHAGGCLGRVGLAFLQNRSQRDILPVAVFKGKSSLS